jgi:hypothetical protein
MHYKVKRSSINGGITFYKKSGHFGNADLSLRLCNTTGCKGVFTHEFTFTPDEVEQMALLNPSSIFDWPLNIRNRYDFWELQPVACPLCGVIARRADLSDTYGFNTSRDRVASIIADFFHLLGDNADILMYINKNPGGLQQAKQLLADTGSVGKYSQALKSAREAHYAVYRVENILRDMATGATLEGRIGALIRS